eukprot:TRINITY_DN15538_c0_g1_i1.p1 TRINITY_DN15538_c0_g1~~TRINITY_DN15538_c0_g1_i1.p1  ORF type:complete len:176 (-),score=35.19 TRINITY_DN15538_c0_g1_i1:68-595(-)
MDFPDDEDAEELRSTLDDFDSAIAKIESTLSPFLEIPLVESTKGLTPQEHAKLYVALVYAIDSLFFLYLKSQGISTSNHAVKEELERVRLYMQKVKELGTKPAEPNMKLNVAAANRFISAGTGVAIPKPAPAAAPGSAPAKLAGTVRKERDAQLTPQNSKSSKKTKPSHTRFSDD